jgi:hypothetical protein
MAWYTRWTVAEKDRVLRELAQEFALNNLRPVSAGLDQETAEPPRTSERLDGSDALDV